jgi:hypothetical protein
MTKPFPRLKKMCLALDGVKTEKKHGRPCFTANGKTFLMFMDNHHGDGRLAIWCKAPPGDQGDLVDLDPVRFFVPPYVGPSGWVGVRLDITPVDWSQVKAIVVEGHRMATAKKKRKK